MDFSVEPAHLDIKLGDGTAETIIEWVDDDTLRMENNFPGQPRPAGFGADTITVTFQETVSPWRVRFTPLAPASPSVSESARAGR